MSDSIVVAQCDICHRQEASTYVEVPVGWAIFTMSLNDREWADAHPNREIHRKVCPACLERGGQLVEQIRAEVHPPVACALCGHHE